MIGLPIAFGAPAVLLALALLPAIWWLLRVTPPRPRILAYGPTRSVVSQIGEEEKTPAKTPWWLTALRLLVAAAVIVALAGPVYKPSSEEARGTGPLLIIVENGWSSAPQWPAIVGADLARLAVPVKLSLPRAKSVPKGAAETGITPNVSGGTLTLRASPAASLEIQHQGPRILERIAAYFGYPLVREIRLEIGDRRRKTAPKRLLSTGPAPALDNVADPDLRAVLQRLGAARRTRPCSRWRACIRASGSATCSTPPPSCARESPTCACAS